jgi:hypothetical protein
MASQDEHHTNSELGEQLQNHQDDDVSTDERDRIAVVQWFVVMATPFQLANPNLHARHVG